MIVIRPITLNDTDAFIELAFEAGIGMTSMPKNPEILAKHVKAADDAFHTDVRTPGNEIYLFVLEDLETGIIGGTCGILARTGQRTPLYFYKIEKEEHLTKGAPQTQLSLLRPVHYYNAPTEICSLYLSPEFRREGSGRLLSLSRFLFMAAFPHRFDPIVFAEMRGFIDKNNFSPYWEGIGKHFCHIDFATLMHLRDTESIDIASILPNHPIYIPLLPKSVQESIGKIHIDTQPALNMLIQEGFYLTEEIDVCDGGPKIEAEIKELRTVKHSCLDIVAEIEEQPSSSDQRYMLCNNRLDFRACFATLQSKGREGQSITQQVAEALQLDRGSTLRYVNAKG